MAVVSFLQRALEGTVGTVLETFKNTAFGMGRSYTKVKGWRNRARDIADVWDFSNTEDAIDEAVESWHRARRRNSVLGYTLFAVDVPFRVVHGAAAYGFDVLKGTLGTAGTVAGTAAGLALGVGVGLPLKATLKAGWKLTKWYGPGIAKAGAKATYAGAYVLGRDALTLTGATAKFLWNTRKSPAVGSLLVGGALVAGAIHGNSNYTEQAMYGHPLGGKDGLIKGFAYMNPEIQAGAWQFTKGAISPAGQKMQKMMDDKGGYEAIQEAYGPLGPDAGATGDLVFALHQLRQGGIF